MITLRQIEKQWATKDYGKLLRELMTGRLESSPRLLLALATPLGAAAMGVIRLDELSQSYLPIYSTLVRKILASQEPDGGWGDPLITAVCLKALLCGQGHGLAIERGIASLAALQKEAGIWPQIPLRRTDADPFTSAYILFQLGELPAFQQGVRFFDALTWFAQNEPKLDPESAKLWQRVQRRLLPKMQNEPKKNAHSAAVGFGGERFLELTTP
jgi:hypothetical protein